MYGMAGNFRGVLTFIIFVVDLAVKKFPPNTRMEAIRRGAWPKTSWKHGQL